MGFRNMQEQLKNAFCSKLCNQTHLLFCHKQSRKKIVPGCTTHEKSHLELPVCFCRKNTLSLEKRPKHRNLHAR